MSGKSNDYGSIKLERRDSVAWIYLARPEKLNALSRYMKDGLRRILLELEGNNELRAVILTGEGERAFCAGTDIADMAHLDEEGAKAFAQQGQELGNQLESFPVPVIAAINGIAAGGGTELALGCHLRIAAKNARFSLPELKLGIIPGYGGTQRLTRVVGETRALEMMLTGASISAEEAWRIGLVNRVVEPADLMREAESLAREISQLAPLAIRACLKAVIGGRELKLDEGLALERKLFGEIFNSEDVREGTSAFLEKRPPAFKGK
ncbi:MAG: enoyl-CoA hydratase-related protein [Pyrinomonadaceae bacterium]